MNEESSDNRLIGKIKGIGDGFTGAAKSLTGQSTADEIAQFSDAYTDALKLMDSDLQSLRRRVALLESDSIEDRNQPIKDPEPVSMPVDRRFSTSVAIGLVAVTLSILALVLAVTL